MLSGNSLRQTVHTQTKQGLDASDMSNYRPVSILSYISKVVERAVAIQLNDYLVANDLLPRVQSAYRKRHSTETALLRVWSDILLSLIHI